MFEEIRCIEGNYRIPFFKDGYLFVKPNVLRAIGVKRVKSNNTQFNIVILLIDNSGVTEHTGKPFDRKQRAVDEMDRIVLSIFNT